jgi:hypothetical protein
MDDMIIKNQYDFAAVFGFFGSVGHFWDDDILQPVDKQDLSDKSFFCGAHGVIVPLKQVLSRNESLVESFVFRSKHWKSGIAKSRDRGGQHHLSLQAESLSEIL